MARAIGNKPNKTLVPTQKAGRHSSTFGGRKQTAHPGEHRKGDRMNRILSCIYIFLCAVLYSNLSYAADNKSPKQISRPPKFYNLGRVDGNDIIRMECESNDPSFTNISCDFVQVSFVNKTESEVIDDREKRKSEYSKITSQDIDDMKKNMSLEISKERQALLNLLTPEKKKHSDKLLNMIKDINKSNTKEDLINAIESMEEFNDKCCSVHINTWKQEFQRISPFKWMNNPGPQGLCNVVSVTTLESYDDSYVLWKYSTVTVSVDVDKKRNDIFDQTCGEIKLNKPTTYSWDIPTDFIADCQCIKY